MKNAKIKYLYAMFALLIVAGLSGCISPAKPGTRVLKYTDHEPLGGMRTQFLNDVLFPAIEKESKGRLKIEAHWGGELSISYNALQTIKDGAVADMGVVVPEYFADKFPLHQVFKSFPTGPFADKQIKLFLRAYLEIPSLPAEVEKEEMVNIFFATGFPTAFFSSKTLNTLEDIKGQKWRTASFWHRSFLRNAGAEPVVIPWGDGVLKALENGALDGVMVNIDSGDDIKAQSAAVNVLVSPDLWLGHVYLVLMNKNTWDGLEKKDRQAIMRAAEKSYKKLGPAMEISLETMIAKMKTDGANIRLLTPQELEEWRLATKFKEVQATWVKEQEDKGIKDAAAVMAKVSALIKETAR